MKSCKIMYMALGINQDMIRLPSGHVAVSIVEFGRGFHVPADFVCKPDLVNRIPYLGTDPDAAQLERYAPTPSSTTVMLRLQIISTSSTSWTCPRHLDSQTRRRESRDRFTQRCHQQAYRGDLHGHWWRLSPRSMGL